MTERVTKRNNDQSNPNQVKSSQIKSRLVLCEEGKESDMYTEPTCLAQIGCLHSNDDNQNGTSPALLQGLHTHIHTHTHTYTQKKGGMRRLRWPSSSPAFTERVVVLCVVAPTHKCPEKITDLPSRSQRRVQHLLNVAHHRDLLRGCEGEVDVVCHGRR